MSKQDNNFEQLLAELQGAAAENETLAKAMPPVEEGKDDDQIAAAAAEGGEELNPEDEELDDDQDGAPMAKSMKIGDEEVQVVDAELLIKSLTDLSDRVETNEGVLAKALASTLDTLKSQGELIKSLQGQVAKLAGTGTGRKTVLTVVDKPAAGEQQLAKSQQPQLTAGDVLAKATAAFGAGKINGLELTTIDVALRQNQQIDQGLLAKALS